jgi:hypothetical protein
VGKADRPKEVKRGTSDELEVLREIVVSDRYLFDKVISRIKTITGSASTGIIDEMGTKAIPSQERERLSKKVK